MKKKILCFILFFIILVIAVIGCISNANNVYSKENQQNKQLSEIKYLDNKITILLNLLNNITFENYNISIEQIDEKTEDTSLESKSKSRSQGEEGGIQEGESSSSSEKSNSTNTIKSSSLNEQESNKKQYEFNRTGVLTRSKTIDWTNIKNQTELLYSVVPTITLDLYQKNVEQENILGFNRELDNLTQGVNAENKEETIIKLANLYSYLPKLSRTVIDEKNTLIFETKSNVFYAYSLLESEDWNQISNYLQKAIQTYTQIFNNLENINNSNISNKCYILLNELYNTVELKNKEIFLIKYKNLLEQLNIL